MHSMQFAAATHVWVHISGMSDSGLIEILAHYQQAASRLVHMANLLKAVAKFQAILPASAWYRLGYSCLSGRGMKHARFTAASF